MSLTITSRERGPVTIVAVEGRLDGGPETARVHETVRALLSEGRRHIVLDLRGVPWANSLAIGVLISAYLCAKHERATLSLCAVPDRVLKVLTICGVVPGVFQVHEDAEHALAASG